MAKYTINDSTLTGIANAIRGKTGKTGQITPANMATEVSGIVTHDLSKDTVTAANLRSGYTAHDKNGNPITGTLKTQKYYTGPTAPSGSLGSDGDLYLRTGG